LALADNKIAANAGWDRPILAIELSELNDLLPEAGLDIQLTGFDAAEIDLLLGDLVDREQDPSDALPAVEPSSVTLSGDLWQLGRNLLLCGDATSDRDFRKLMGGERATMIFADPPYNLRIASVQGRGRIKHREFSKASGEMTPSEFTEFLTASMRGAISSSENGAIHFICIDWRHLSEMLAAGNSVYTELKNVVVWNKTNAGQGAFYRSQHELIFVFKSGTAPHVNNIELGKHGRNRSNIWSYPGGNTFRAGRMDELAAHPTVKPVALVADAIRDCSRRGDVVLDPFMGFGTTILAAERIGRRAYGIEIDPFYVDAAIRRWQNFTKSDAILSGTLLTFDEVASSRLTAIRKTRL
jgi:DNA modification methylase